MSDVTKPGTAVQLATAENHKANVKLFKTQHDLHVLLIMQQLDVNKPQAETLAWAEGQLGYAQRMGKLV